MINKIKEKIANGETVTLTFVGDSITQGTTRHSTKDETFVAYVTDLLAADFKDTKVVRYDGRVVSELEPLDGYEEILVQDGDKGRINVLRSGVGGNTIVRAMNRFSDYTGILPCGTRSDFIFTMFGINDALMPDPKKYVTNDVFKVQYSDMLDKLAKAEPQAEIIVLTATTNGDSIREYVYRTYEIVKEKDLPMIDTYDLWTKHYDPQADNYGHGDWLFGHGDACHPMPKAAKIMAEFIYDNFKRL